MAAIWVFANGATWGVYFMVPLYLTKELLLSIIRKQPVWLLKIGGIAVVILCGFLVDSFSLKK
jgi:putative flippase GtrA